MVAIEDIERPCRNCGKLVRVVTEYKGDKILPFCDQACTQAWLQKQRERGNKDV